MNNLSIEELQKILIKKAEAVEVKYETVFIPKKDGTKRRIDMPNEELKSIQKEILELLNNQYKFSKFVTGFVKNRNIYTNAIQHKGKKFIFQFDIKDFFPSCEYNDRIASILASYSFGDKRLDLVKKIFYYNNTLPQGSPLSPFAANLHAQDMDIVMYSVLRKAISDDISYSRYADDITISSNSKAIFSKTCFRIVERIMKAYGFKINYKKVRRVSPSGRRCVTGLNITHDNRVVVSSKFRKLIRAVVHNHVNKKRILTDEEKMKWKGYLSFCMQVPEHKNWAKDMMNMLN